jgi:transcriptional pleiotropic regulator of transition state genes
MKSFGIKSKLTKNGEIKLPDMLLGLSNVSVGDTLELHLEDNKIIMKKYPPVCVFCESEKTIMSHKGRSICGSCVQELKAF